MDIVTTVSMVVAVGLLAWVVADGRRRAPAPALPTGTPAAPKSKPSLKPFSIEGLRSLGRATGSVALVEYADYECQFCRRFEKSTLPLLRRDYIDSGKLTFIFRNFPLTTLHAEAMAGAIAAECAGAQGQFWPMHDRLLSGESLDKATIQALAASLKLNMPSFQACTAGTPPRAIAEDEASAKELGLTGTPTFLLGRLDTGGIVRPVEVISGARPFEEFTAKIDALLLNQSS